MRIIACFKATPDTADIKVTTDRVLEYQQAPWRIGGYDLNAIEAARQLGDQTDAEVIGLTLGSPDATTSKIRKDALSRGLDKLIVVNATADADTFQTASALAEAINALDGFDLVLLGAGSSDRYAQQVGNQLGALLGVPTLNQVNGLHQQEVGSLRVERELDHSVQLLDVALPAVISVTSGINTPRIAGMKDILAAGKKPVEERATQLASASSLRISTLAREQVERRHQVVEGDAATTAAQLANFLTSI